MNWKRMLAYGSLGRSGLLHGRSLDGGWINDLLRADVHASGKPESMHRRNHDFARPALDGADGTKHELSGGRLSQWLPVSLARSRCKILLCVRWDPGGGGDQGN